MRSGVPVPEMSMSRERGAPTRRTLAYCCAVAAPRGSESVSPPPLHPPSSKASGASGRTCIWAHTAARSTTVAAASGHGSRPASLESGSSTRSAGRGRPTSGRPGALSAAPDSAACAPTARFVIHILRRVGNGPIATHAGMWITSHALGGQLAAGLSRGLELGADDGPAIGAQPG